MNKGKDGLRAGDLGAPGRMQETPQDAHSPGLPMGLDTHELSGHGQDGTATGKHALHLSTG